MIQEFYAKLSENEKKIFYAAIGMVILALFDILFLRPVFSRLASIDKEITEKKNSIKQDLRFLTYKDKILNEQEAYQTFETDERKTEEEIIAGFLKTVELLASESSINLAKLNPAGSTPKKGFVLYHAVLECDGRLTDMVEFMHRIDMTENLLKVDQIDMSGNKASAENVKASMKIAKLIIDPQTMGNYDFSDPEATQPYAGGGGGGKGAGLSAGGAQNTVSSGAGGSPGSGAGAQNSAPPGAVRSQSGTGTGRPQPNGPEDLYLGKEAAASQRGAAVAGGAAGGGGDYNRLSSGGIGGPERGGRSNVRRKDRKKEPEKEKTEVQKKFSDLRKGGRVRVQSIEVLWERLWSKAFPWWKPKESGTPDILPQDYPEEEEESNLWEEKFRRR